MYEPGASLLGGAAGLEEEVSVVDVPVKLPLDASVKVSVVAEVVSVIEGRPADEELSPPDVEPLAQPEIARSIDAAMAAAALFVITIAPLVALVAPRAYRRRGLLRRSSR